MYFVFLCLQHALSPVSVLMRINSNIGPQLSLSDNKVKVIRKTYPSKTSREWSGIYLDQSKWISDQ